MKLEFEKDIPSFIGKSLTEKYKLRKIAKSIDPTIDRLELWGSIVAGLLIGLLLTFVPRYFSLTTPNSLFLSLLLLIVIAAANQLFKSMFITHRVRKALEINLNQNA